MARADSLTFDADGLRATIPVLVVAALLLTGGVLRVSAWRSTGWLAPGTYSQLFTLHGALSLATLPLALLWFAPQVRSLHVVVVLLLQALCLVPPGLTVLPVSAQTMAAATGVAFGPASASVVAATFLRSDAPPLARGTFAVAAAVQCAAWIAMAVGVYEAAGVVLFSVVLAVVAAPLFESLSAAPAIAILGYALSRTAVRYRGVYWLALGELIAGLTLLAFVWASTTREESWLRWVRRVEALAFAEGLVLTAFLGALDVELHLHDTYFAVSAMHFEGLVLVFALLRSARRAGDSRWGWLGLLLASLGAQVFGLAMAELGTRGMPRRYVHYLPQFTSLHRVISVGAFMFLAGLVAVVAAHVTTGKTSRKTS